MLRRKVDKPEDPAPDTEEKEPVGESVEIVEADPRGENVEEPGLAPDPAPAASRAPDPGPAAPAPPDPGLAAPAPPVTGPVAQHSPEPQTAAERLTQQQQSIHAPSVPDPKDQMKERREASRLQRKADKAKRKADKKSAKEARKARRRGEEDGALSLDPLSPTSPPPDPDPQSAPPAGSPAAGIAAAATGTETSRPQPERPVDLPPITPAGGHRAPAARRTAALIGGIDLGGTKIAAAVLDENHKVLAYRRRPTPDRGGPADVVRAMATTL